MKSENKSGCKPSSVDVGLVIWCLFNYAVLSESIMILLRNTFVNMWLFCKMQLYINDKLDIFLNFYLPVVKEFSLHNQRMWGTVAKNIILMNKRQNYNNSLWFIRDSNDILLIAGYGLLKRCLHPPMDKRFLQMHEVKSVSLRNQE